MGGLDTVSTADFLRDGGAAALGEIEEIEVLEENWVAVMVFRRCRPSWLTGMHAPMYDGVTAQELEAALRVLRVPPEAHGEVLASVDVMVAATREAYSEARE